VAALGAIVCGANGGITTVYGPKLHGAPNVISQLHAHIVNQEPNRRDKRAIMLTQNLWFLAFAEIISRTFFFSAFWFGGT
jgi:hypothetical protein